LPQSRVEIKAGLLGMPIRAALLSACRAVGSACQRERNLAWLRRMQRSGACDSVSRYGKLGNWIPKFSSPAAGQNRVFTIRGIFATHIARKWLENGRGAHMKPLSRNV
jgi:hypothetical protein